MLVWAKYWVSTEYKQDTGQWQLHSRTSTPYKPAISIPFCHSHIPTPYNSEKPLESTWLTHWLCLATKASILMRDEGRREQSEASLKSGSFKSFNRCNTRSWSNCRQHLFVWFDFLPGSPTAPSGTTSNFRGQWQTRQRNEETAWQWTVTP